MRDFIQLETRVRTASQEFAARLGEFLRGEEDKLDPIVYGRHVVPKLAPDLMLVADGEQLTRDDFASAIRWRRGGDPDYSVQVLDLELRRASDGLYLVFGVVREASGGGYVLSVVLAETEGRLRAIHAHATGTPTPESFVPARLGGRRLDLESVRLIPPSMCHKYECIPVKRVSTKLHVALVDPANTETIEDLRFLTGCDIVPVKMDRDMILEAIAKHCAADADD